MKPKLIPLTPHILIPDQEWYKKKVNSFGNYQMTISDRNEYRNNLRNLWLTSITKEMFTGVKKPLEIYKDIPQTSKTYKKALELWQEHPYREPLFIIKEKKKIVFDSFLDSLKYGSGCSIDEYAYSIMEQNIPYFNPSSKKAQELIYMSDE